MTRESGRSMRRADTAAMAILTWTGGTNGPYIPPAPAGAQEREGLRPIAVRPLREARPVATPPLRAGSARTLRGGVATGDRKSTRLNSSHSQISYAVFCLKKKKNKSHTHYLK